MTEKNYQAIQDVAELKTIITEMIKRGNVFGFDIEAGYTGKDREKVALQQFHPDWILVGFSFTDNLQGAYYVPVAHDDEEVNIGNTKEVAELFKKLLSTGKGVAHNAKYEIIGISRWLWELGLAVPGTFFTDAYSDTMLEAAITQKYPPKNMVGGVGNSLDGLVLHIFNHQMTQFKELFAEDVAAKKYKAREVRFNTRKLTRQVIEYACEDALWCLALHYEHYPEVKDNFIYKLEMSLLKEVIPHMEYEGLTLDWKLAEDKYAELTDFTQRWNEEVQSEFSRRLGREVAVNFGSPKQVQELLFDPEKGLGMEPRKLTNTGAPSTDAKALAYYSKGDETIKRLLQYRELKKLDTSYIKKYVGDLHYADRAYPNHNQLGAGTGRFSVDDISYQQWPKSNHYQMLDGTEFDFNFRDMLICPEGFRGVGFDFSQVELRFLAGLSGEDSMIHAFETGQDMHKFTASRMYNKPIEDVTPTERQAGKGLGFAMVYQSGAGSIAETLSTPENPVSEDDAKDLMNKYFAAFPKLAAFFESQKVNGRRNGYVDTIFGRRYTLWEYTSDFKHIQQSGDRLTINHPCQGGSADYLKIGMVRAMREIRNRGWQDKAKLVMTVHDALEFYLHESISTEEFIQAIQPTISFPVEGLPYIKAEWHEFTRYGTEIEIDLTEDNKIKSYEYGGKSFNSFQEAIDYLESPQEEEPTVAKKELTVTIPEMPTKAAFGEFLTYVKENPGEVLTVLSTPQGDVPLPSTSFSEKDVAQLKELLVT